MDSSRQGAQRSIAWTRPESAARPRPALRPVRPPRAALTPPAAEMPACRCSAGEVVAVVGSDVAVPASNGLAEPTWAPPLVHPPAVVWAGAQRKKVTVPVGTGPAPPLPMVTESVAETPGAAPVPPGALVLEVAGSRHERNATGPAKSLRPDVND